MHYYVIVPAHNEEGFLADTLNSILRQSLQPKRVVVVNDNSTDNTEAIIDQFRALSPIFTKLNTLSSTEHMPGSKVINAFDKGLQLLDKDYEFIVKLDADLILPDNYFEKIAYIFRGQPKVGIAGGFIYEQDETREWKLNHPMDKNHVRGAFKAYTNKCFKAIDGLRNAMGWDTVDELLAQYHGFEIYTDDTLKVKHLRPTGNAYNQKAKLLQGKAMYTMRYGLLITVIASLKMAFKQRKPQAFSDNLYGYLEAKKENTPFLVSKSEGQFIRHLRWKNIKNKLF
ncbi:glycosyltransferase family 2 protein [Zobellia galactanivorans]|uniref:glycosyltransferase family 2 protein n=1 Tax=Zobellia galactanivorans (strain DSM 12802 / CCUG 47099 / CIP 106680 / NCIMB 13871 / Dsij) TaxID=63186 RepID=UPI0026E1331F|nr:glycosyltransferase family 2 protein [Zobellia galactanivorans]MDO6807144.1 glycosyltransferase family 2 protein [Zobellia galactanivorans]